MALKMYTEDKPIKGLGATTEDLPPELVELLMTEVPTILASDGKKDGYLMGETEGETKKYWLYASKAWTGRVNNSRTNVDDSGNPLTDDDGNSRVHPLAKPDQNLIIRRLPARKGQPEMAYRFTAEYVPLDHVGPGRKPADATPEPAATPAAADTSKAKK